tara:strand:+ start:8337 stop:8612 length:276 start_codon:yes stop_codon:yes gene_type:complete
VKTDKIYLWVGAVVVFFIGRLFVSELYSQGTLIGGIIYSLVMAGFIIPYILGENIQIPSYSHMLVKGEDDIYRLVYFLIGCCICVAALLAP